MTIARCSLGNCVQHVRRDFDISHHARCDSRRRVQQHVREQGEWHERSGAPSLDLVGADLQPLYAHYVVRAEGVTARTRHDADRGGRRHEHYRCDGGGGRLAEYDVAVVGVIAVCWDGGTAARISSAACSGD
jgi:hypothetical protein